MNAAPYTRLFTYWFALIIYDYTVFFCRKWILSTTENLSPLRLPDKRTADQMVQAARSGKQNIAEGSEELKTSLKMGITLTNVAKASQEELLVDYEDFLRQNEFEVWDKNDPRVKVIRARSARLVSTLSNLSNLGQAAELIHKELPFPTDPEQAANFLLTLCHQATYLLNRQVEALERKHEREGGYSEKLYQKRVEYRKLGNPK